MAKIEHLPTANGMSPETLLHMVLEDIVDIDGVVVICKDEDGHMWSSWSSMTRAELALAALYFNKMVTREII